MQKKPIYTDSPDALKDVRGDWRGADSLEVIPDWMKAHRPLIADLRAQVTTGRTRPVRRRVALKVVIIDEGGRGQGRLGEVIMEQVVGDSATGELYPADTMAGVITDHSWRSALDAAHGYARECGFGIAPGTDVRWAVHVLKPGESWEAWGDTDENKPRPLKAGEQITGRSAGVAFFLGLFALAQGEGSSVGWEARRVVESIVALATLPETEIRAAVDPLGTLGGEEKRKLEALKYLPERLRVVVVFPTAFGGIIQGGHESLEVTTVGGLAAVMRARCGTAFSTSSPDSLPVTSRAVRYIGGRGDVERLTDAIRTGGWHTVSGPGGVGKTARVVEATDALWKEGVFPGGRFWIDLCGTDGSARKSDLLAAEAIVKACGENRPDKDDDLRKRALYLLGLQPSLVLLEGAETVAESDFTPLLELFPSNATVVWMTRRETDAQHPRLRGAKWHAVGALSSQDALELLCYTADRKVEELSETERPIWAEIAESTERIPLLLGWAGEALRPDWDTTATDYLAELKSDPLGALSSPYDRETQNAGRFLRRSLARIAPTSEIPDLPEVAERLFAALAAFAPTHGAPLAWWPLAAGLDTSNADGKRRFNEARRRLLGLGLVTRRTHANSADGTAATVHPVHALAGKLAAELWSNQSDEQRLAVLSSLFHAAIASLNQPLPPQWFYDKAWVAGRTAEAAHYGHWLDELTKPACGDVTAELEAIIRNLPEIALLDAWLDFLRNHVSSYPLLDLKDTAWNVVCDHFEGLRSIYPENPTGRVGLVESLNELGGVCKLREDFTEAETVFFRAMEATQALVEENPNNPDFQDLLADAHDRIGDNHFEREDWDAAERAYKRGIEITKKLVEKYPDVSGYQNRLAVFWGRVGAIRTARGASRSAKAAFEKARIIREGLADPLIGQFRFSNRLGELAVKQEDWDGAKTKFKQAIEIGIQLIEANPLNSDHRKEVADCWDKIGRACEGQQDLAGAEEAFYQSLELRRNLTADFPDRPIYMEDLACAWSHLANVREAQQDFVGAEERLTHALEIDQKLTSAYSGVPKFLSDLAASWFRLAELRMALGNLSGGEEAINHALEIDQQLAEDHPDVPDYQESLAFDWEELGVLRMYRSDWDGAIVLLNRSWEIQAKLVAAQPHSFGLSERLSRLWFQLGQSHKMLQDLASAEAAFTAALDTATKFVALHPDFAIATKLLASKPDVQKFQRNLAAYWSGLGDMCKARQDWVGAEAAFNSALEIDAKLASVLPDSPDHKDTLARSLDRLGRIKGKQGNWADAEPALTQAIKIRRELAAENPDQPNAEKLVEACDILVTLADKRGDLYALEKALMESLRVCESLSPRWPNEPFFDESAIRNTCQLALLLKGKERNQEAAELAHSGLARARRLEALLQRNGEEMKDWHKDTITELAKLGDPDSGEADM